MSAIPQLSHRQASWTEGFLLVVPVTISLSFIGEL